MTESADSPRYVSRYRSHAKLFAVEAQLAAYAMFRGTVPGCENRHLLAVCTRGRVEAFLDRDERAASRDVGWRVMRAAGALDEFVREAHEAAEYYVARSKETSAAVVNDSTSVELAVVVDALFRAQARCLAYYNLSGDECIGGIEDHLLGELKRKYGNDASALLHELVAPKMEGLATIREQRAWKEILRGIANGEIGAATLEPRLQAHLAQYRFLGAGGGHPQGWDLRHLYDRLAIEEAADQTRTPEMEMQSATATKIDVGPEMQALASGLATLATNRLALRETIIACAHYTNDFFQALYFRASTASPTTSDDIRRQLSVNDVLQNLRSGSPVDVATLERRYERYTIELDGKNLRLLAGADAECRLGELSFAKPPTTLKGRCAHARAPVVGRVRVIDSGDHTSAQDEATGLMSHGEILVTGMTHPKMVLACSKAAAIVTDEGGITCHAAIIARELNIPCVVGTKNATTILTTGDYVRVHSALGSIERLGDDALDGRILQQQAAAVPRSSSVVSRPSRGTPKHPSRSNDGPFVRYLATDCADAVEVGQKAAGLMSIFRSVDVPPGYVITTSAFRAHMRSVVGVENWAVLLERSEDLSSTRAAIEQTPLPALVEDAIRTGLAEIRRPVVAVRSSATTEDTEHASAAGQHMTALCVEGEERIVRSVRACYASLFGQNAIAYRRSRGLPLFDVEMAVIVQQMVPAEASGVMFTVSPVDSDSNIVIEAAYGYGTAVVDGVVTPDSYLVHRERLAIADTVIGSKARMARAADGGGVELVHVDSDRRGRVCLSADEVLELARLGLRLEEALGGPLDIEWVVGPARKIFVLQARPITTRLRTEQGRDA